MRPKAKSRRDADATGPGAASRGMIYLRALLGDLYRRTGSSCPVDTWRIVRRLGGPSWRRLRRWSTLLQSGCAQRARRLHHGTLLGHD